MYATHIFDGLSDWITHLALVGGGKHVRGGPVAEFPELRGRKVLHAATGWLREERQKAREQPSAAAQAPQKSKSDLFGSRQMAYYR